MQGRVHPGDVSRIAIVGTGTIGSGWAAVYLAKGYSVTAYVRTQASEDKFYSFLQSAWSKILVRGVASASDTDGWRRVKCVRSLAECVATADYVQESVVEELGLSLCSSRATVDCDGKPTSTSKSHVHAYAGGR